jgi:hypothetical protein
MIAIRGRSNLYLQCTDPQCNTRKVLCWEIHHTVTEFSSLWKHYPSDTSRIEKLNFLVSHYFHDFWGFSLSGRCFIRVFQYIDRKSFSIWVLNGFWLSFDAGLRVFLLSVWLFMGVLGYFEGRWGVFFLSMSGNPKTPGDRQKIENGFFRSWHGD